MAIGTVTTGVQITRDLIDAGDAYKNRIAYPAPGQLITGIEAVIGMD